VGPNVALPEQGPSEAPEGNCFSSAALYLLKAADVPTGLDVAIPSLVGLEGNRVPGGAVHQTNSRSTGSKCGSAGWRSPRALICEA
jgi:hypothetical protein